MCGRIDAPVCERFNEEKTDLRILNRAGGSVDKGVRSCVQFGQDCLFARVPIVHGQR